MASETCGSIPEIPLQLEYCEKLIATLEENISALYDKLIQVTVFPVSPGGSGCDVDKSEMSVLGQRIKGINDALIVGNARLSTLLSAIKL